MAHMIWRKESFWKFESIVHSISDFIFFVIVTMICNRNSNKFFFTFRAFSFCAAFVIACIARCIWTSNSINYLGQFSQDFHGAALDLGFNKKRSLRLNMKTFLNFYKQHSLDPTNFLRNNIESLHPIPKLILGSIYNIFRQLKIQTLELSLRYEPKFK